MAQIYSTAQSPHERGRINLAYIRRRPTIFTGVTLNVASGIGFIALFGVAVMNGVIMVANLNRHRDLGGPLIDAVVAGANERLRPVLMSATVATIGMLPAALATGVGSDVQRSLATVVAGGLL